MDNRSIIERLKQKGFIVTDEVNPKSYWVRKIVDINGNNYGFLEPLEALKLTQKK